MINVSNPDRLLIDNYIKEYTGSFGVKDKQRCTTSPWSKDESHPEKSELQILLQVSSKYAPFLAYLVRRCNVNHVEGGSNPGW